MRVIVVDAQGTRKGGEELLQAAPTEDGAWLWVDVVAPGRATLDNLQSRFDIPSRVFARTEELMSAEEVRPRYHPIEAAGWLVWRSPQSIDTSSAEWKVVPATLQAFINDHLLVTLHPRSGNVVDRVKNEYGANTVFRSPYAALRAVLDVLATDVGPLVSQVGGEIEAFEDDILDDDRQPGKEQLAHLYDIRRILLEMQRDVGPDRDAVRGIERQLSYLNNPSYRDFEGTGDQLGLAEEMIQTERDVASAAMDLYLSAQNNRMNEIMKQLTVVATIFMPLTLLSGIYGMNVLAGMWPPVRAVWSFWAVVGSMIVIAAAMAAWFRKKKWW